jgi:hypothetical protein
MRASSLILAAVIAAASPAASKPIAHASYRGVPVAALIAAAKTAHLTAIDALETYCDGDTAIGDWLTALTAPETRAIAWTAGKCDLANSLNPMDSGGTYCVQATLTLKRPTSRDDLPEIEIYLEDPKHGRPGEVYAFRAVFDTVDGPDYIRFRKDFEADWRARFADAPPPACED